MSSSSSSLEIPKSFNKITVLGSGVMGHGIAQVSAMAGYNVALRDIDRSFLDKALDKIQWSLNKLVEKKRMTQSEAEQIMNRIVPIVELQESLKNAELVIEAIPEEIGLKRKLYFDIDRYAEPKTVYASNTSTLPISEMAILTSRPDRFIGLHFFNPPQLMQLVEVIPGKLTRPDLTDMAINFIKKIGKEPVLCKKDVPGFIVNRIFIPLIHEALHCRDRDGASKEQIDLACKSDLAFPMGIFELADYTGIDVIHKATIEMYSRDKKVVNPHPEIKRLFEEKKFGQKTGEGFYNYNAGTAYERIKITDDKAEKYYPIKLLAVAANNAAWLLSNQVCNEEDLDKALRLGMGLKESFFSILDRFGIHSIIDTLKEMALRYSSDFYNPDFYLLNYNRS
ncbi:MAG TPA: 3-hydroxyacyl-CoA dehydrogenase family protein [Nitrososphaeraceae archaeon]|jgi:enoyl-CoA hydratase/3-hydroxyacyl-CoA dehydrogenase|nr:3-hydroxyacyl-CoA dehydrogenase family protein [Nitrososphaeraceae archaeon]